MTSRLEDLRARLLQEQRTALASAGRGDGFTFSRAMLEHASANLPLWRTLAGKETGAFVLARIHEMLGGLVRNDLASLGYSQRGPEREALVEYLTGGFIALMIWWLGRGTKLSVEDVDARFHKLEMHGLVSFGASPANDSALKSTYHARHQRGPGQ